MNLDIELPYPVTSGNHSVRHAANHYLTPEAREYHGRVLQACLRAGVAGMKLAGPLLVEVLAYPPDAKARDADNLLKVTCDALTRAGLWKDDSNKVIRMLSLEWLDVVPGGLISMSIQVKG